MGKDKKEPVLEENKGEKNRKNSDRSRSSSSSNRSSDDDYNKSRRSHYRSRSYSRSRSRSYERRRERPNKSRILGVFGLSQHTIQDDLFTAFSYYGPIYDLKIIYDLRTGNSRGFGFIYFDRIQDAQAARDGMNGTYLHGRRIRVDYSVTKRAHSPTPGRYMGFQSSSCYRNRYSSSSYYDRRSRRYHHSSRSNSR